MWIINKPIVNLVTVLQDIKCQVFWCFKNTFFLNNCTLTIHVRSLVDWWQNLNHTQTKTFSTCYCHANFYHTSTKQNTFLIFIVSKAGDSTDFWVLLVILIYIQIEKRALNWNMMRQMELVKTIKGYKEKVKQYKVHWYGSFKSLLLY